MAYSVQLKNLLIILILNFIQVHGSTQSITGVGFQPDWTWIKNRSTANTNHRINRCS
jgi:hypothetical protein